MPDISITLRVERFLNDHPVRFLCGWLRGAGSSGRLDVVIHAEKVRRIVLILEQDEPLIIRTIGSVGEGVSFIGDVVYVGAGHEKGRYRRAPQWIAI